MVLGGVGKTMFSDMWLLDVARRSWSKVHLSFHIMHVHVCNILYSHAIYIHACTCTHVYVYTSTSKPF